MNNNEQSLDRLIAELPAEIAPTRDLWPQIASQIAQTKQDEAQPTAQPRRHFWHLAAASVLIALLVSLLMVPTPEVELVKAEPAPAQRLLVAQLITEFEREKSRQLATLTQVPTEFADFERQLKIWQRACAQVEMALANQPDDIRLLKKLTRLQQQQLHYLNKVTRVSQLS